MAQHQPQKHSIKHEAILQYLLGNPTATYSQVAAEFGMTISWVSCVVNSDCFRKQLKDRQDELFGSTVVQPIREKVEATAHLAIDKLMDKVQVCEDVGTLTNTADKMLGKLGFGSPANGSGQNNTQNNFFIGEGGSALLARARAAQLEAVKRREVKEVDSATEAAYSYSSLPDTPAPIPLEAPAWAEEAPGDSLRAEGTPPDGEEV